MATAEFKFDVRKAQLKIDRYAKSLDVKAVALATELSKRGIQVAKSNIDGYGSFITFTRQVTTSNKYEAIALVVGSGADIVREWELKDGSIKSATINTLLMCEFGSGRYAINPLGVVHSGTGQVLGRGSFPGQTHANDPSGWWYLPVGSDEWQHSYGVKPRAPMYKAAMTMEAEIISIARGVFR